MVSRQKVAMVVAELMGVTVLATAVYAIAGQGASSLFVGLVAGTALGLLVHTIGSASGAHVNPAITLGLWSVRKIKTTQALLYIAAQVVGAFAALGVIRYLLGHTLNNLTAEEFDWKFLIAEAAGALVFGFGVASAVYQKYEGTKLAFTVGGSLFIGILVASLGSNAVLNPAVAWAIRSFSVEYAVGPIIGSIVGMNLYALVFSDEVVIKRPAVAAARKTTTTKVAAAKKKPASKTAKKPAAKKRR